MHAFEIYNFGYAKEAGNLENTGKCGEDCGGHRHHLQPAPSSFLEGEIFPACGESVIRLRPAIVQPQP